MNRRELIGLLTLLPGCSFTPQEKVESMKAEYDVIIFGGGPAGLSAAMTLGRGLRKVLVFDDQKPRNAPAKHMQNFPSHDGLPPSEFKKLMLQDLKKYPNVSFMNVRVEELKSSPKGFEVIAHGKIYYGRKIIMAHGMRDQMLPIPGFENLWGKAIFQCPYCHGFEIQNEPIALIGNGKVAFHMLPLLKGLSQDLILFTNGEEVENQEIIEKNGIKIYSEKITSFNHAGEKLKSLSLENNLIVDRNFIFLHVKQSMSTNLALNLGVAITDMGFYQIDDFNKTTVDGIYAAGDSASMRQSVLNACASGQMTGAAVNFSLLNEDFLK